MERKMKHNAIGMLAALLMLFVAGCSSDDDADVYYMSLYMDSNTAYKGRWSINDVAIDSCTMVWNVNGMTFMQMPCEYIVKQAVEVQYQTEAIANITADIYSVGCLETGYSDQARYLSVLRNDYEFGVRYAGADHKVRLVMNNTSVAVQNLGDRTLNVMLNVVGVELDGQTKQAYTPALVMNFKTNL